MLLPYAYALTALALCCIGLLNVLLHRNLIRKSLGINLFVTGIFLFFGAGGYLEGGAAPILHAQTQEAPAVMVNPIPAALILTGLVVSVSMTAFFLALCSRIWRRYGSLDLDLVLLRSAAERARAHLLEKELAQEQDLAGQEQEEGA